MRFDNLLNDIQQYHSVVADPSTVSELIQASYHARLASVGINKVVLLPNHGLVVNVQGYLREQPASEGIIEYYHHFFVMKLDWLLDKNWEATDKDHRQMEQALAAYELEGDGAYVWIVPDGYMASLTEREQQWAAEGGGYFSHESMCVLNTSGISTRCTLDVYYESDTSLNFSHEFQVDAHQSVHYRLDKMLRHDGTPMILKDQPVAYRITSHDARVVVQGSRILTSGENSEFGSFGTVIAWTPVG